MPADMLLECEKPFMHEAFVEARTALAEGEVPVGCVFVVDGAVVARGRNTVNAERNATRHAEMNCVDQVLVWRRQQKRCSQTAVEEESRPTRSEESCDEESESVWRSVDVYVTVEPCAMCIDALSQLRVRSVTFGCSNDRFGGCGSVVSVPEIYGYNIFIRRDVCKEEAVQLLKDFYKGENPNAPSGKAKRKHSK